MDLIRIVPRGYCHGVVSAINIVANTLKDENTPRPIYIIGQIIHNKKVTDAFTEAGAITLSGKNRRDIMNQVESGTVIITAHGIDYNLIIDAKARGLNVVDATCRDVYKTHDIVKEAISDGFDVIYIGQKGHPETDAVLAINEAKIHLVEKGYQCDDVPKVNSEKVLITNQTTLSLWDLEELISIITKVYPNAIVHNEICDATQQRQEAVMDASIRCDMIVVVGDPKSNNTNKLVEVSEKNGKTKAIRIETLHDLDCQVLKGIKTIGVTAGASTPSILVKQVGDFLEQFVYEDENTWEMPEVIAMHRLIPITKNK